MSIVIVLLAKVTLLLVAAAAGNTALFPRRAAARHFVWTLALAGVLALALLGPVAPSLTVRLPAWAPVGGTADAAASRAVDAGFEAPKTPPSLSPLSAVASDAAVRPARGATISLPAGLWIIGTLAVFLWSVVGHVALRRITRRSTTPSASEWPALLDEARADMGVTRPVRLALTRTVGAPATWGWRRPVVLLPGDAEAWPIERRRAVLRHELAHVSRHDFVLQLVSTAACGVYWFHPLVWLAARQLRIASEHACDDRVLSGGIAATDYAAELLEIARGARGHRAFGIAAVGMARPSHLETRLRAILDQTRTRRAPSPSVRLAAAGAFVLALMPLAGLRAETRAETRAMAPPVDDQEPASTLDREVAASPGEVLILDLETGGAVDLRPTDEALVRVRTRLGGRDWRDTRVTVERVGGGVRVQSRHQGHRGSSTSHAFEIRLPRQFDVRLNSAGGDVTIVGLEGTFRGNTGGGDLVLERASGRAELSTGGGDVHVSDSELDGSVSTGGGTVDLVRIRGGLRGSSGSGPVVSKDGPEGEGAIRIVKAGGAVDLPEAPEGATISTGGGRVHVGRASGMVEVKTGGGDVKIGPVSGSVRAGTGAGEVVVTLVEADGDEQSVDIQTGNGPVVVELPSGIDARFDLETAYTERLGRPTRIDSDWELTREATPTWDAREGTPRRYVRARGQAGRGRGVIRIRTVNGDIVVRRGGS